MERVLSQDDRIKRAEEIYLRRKNNRERTRHATVNISEPRNFKLLKRVILQAVICILIYFIFYLINTTDYSFSSITLNRTNELISNDFDFIGVFNSIKDYISNYIYNTYNKTEEVKDSEQKENIEDNRNKYYRGEKRGE